MKGEIYSYLNSRGVIKNMPLQQQIVGIFAMLTLFVDVKIIYDVFIKVLVLNATIASRILYIILIPLRLSVLFMYIPLVYAVVNGFICTYFLGGVLCHLNSRI